MMPSVRPSRSRKPGSIGAMTSTMALPMVRTSNRWSATGLSPGAVWETSADYGIAASEAMLSLLRRLPLRFGRLRLGLIEAPLGNDAVIALRHPRLADIATVQ